MAEIDAGTIFKQIGFALTSGVEKTAEGQIKMYLENTSDATILKSTNWTPAVAGMTQVYNGAYNLPITSTAADIILDLDAPFTYTGGGLYVAYEYIGSSFSNTPAAYTANNSLTIGTRNGNSATALPEALGSSAFRPQMIFGYDNLYQHDISVSRIKAEKGIYSPFLGGNNKFKALIRNKGSVNATNINVDWEVSGGPVPGNFSQTIPSLAVGDSTEIELTIPSEFTANGTLQVRASTGSDENISNNTKTTTQVISCDQLRYAASAPPDDGIGFNTAEGIITAQYKTEGIAITIDAIKMMVSTHSTNDGKTIKGTLLDASGAIIATSANFPLTTANMGTEITIPLTTPVTIPANTSFYAGISQPVSAGFYPVGTLLPAENSGNKYYSFLISGGTPALITNLGDLMLGFSGKPVAQLSSSVTGALKQGQRASFTATPGFSNYQFRVNNTLYQNTSSNTFIYTPDNNDQVTVSVGESGCSQPATNVITMQVNEITPTNGIVYVKKGASGNGSSWANAAGELSDVLLAANINAGIQQIWMAGGKYIPAYNANDNDRGTNGNRYNSFAIPGSRKIYGGFAGTETSLSQRNLNLIANKTILSGDLDNNDDANGAIVGDNAYHVVMATGTGIALLDGVTISGGNANDRNIVVTSYGAVVNGHMGGALFSYNKTIQLNHVIIQGNQAYTGAGVFTDGLTTTIANSLIAGNKATFGGGIMCSTGQVSIINTTISGNNATTGGGMYNDMSNTSIVNSIMYGNNSGIEGNPVSITYSTLQETNAGTGNIESDPLFVNMPDYGTAPFIGGDYRLKQNSPGIDAGNNIALQSLPADLRSTDILGNTRIMNEADGGIIDMGAYELQRANQTITVTDLNKTYGDAAFEPGATASSGLTVSYASSDNNIAEAFQDAADGNKWKIRVKRAGVVTITASQAGTALFYPAPDKTFDLNIAKKAITVQLTNTVITKVYDGTTDGTLALSNLSIATGDVMPGDNLSLNISATDFSYDDKNVGENKLIRFPVSAVSLTGTSVGNYSIGNTTDLTANTGTITKASITVTANPQTKVYGESDPALTYAYNGFVSGDAQTFTGGLSRATGEDAGTYAISQNTLSAGSNYSIQYTGANFVITKATQSITWVQDLITGCNGVAPITLTATSSSGLPVSYQVGNSSIANVNAQTLTPVREGATSITAVQEGDNNYEAAIAVVKNFSYQLSSALRQHFAEVLFFNNSGNNYVQWQWYKNGNQIPGFNTPYYTEPTALNGIYYVTVTDKNGNIVQTCPITLNGTGVADRGVKVSPNPARTGNSVTISCNYSETALQGATLQISGVSGTVVQRITNVRPVNTVVMPATGGLYVITLTLANGQKATVNVLVN